MSMWAGGGEVRRAPDDDVAEAFVESFSAKRAAPGTR